MCNSKKRSFIYLIQFLAYNISVKVKVIQNTKFTPNRELKCREICVSRKFHVLRKWFSVVYVMAASFLFLEVLEERLDGNE